MQTNTINIQDITNLLNASENREIRRKDTKEEIYRWIQDTVVSVRYLRLGKKEKGKVLRYLTVYSGYSTSHIKRLVRQYAETGYVRMKGRTQPMFPVIYTAGDIRTLAETMDAYGHQNGKAVRETLREMYAIYGDNRFVRLRHISPAHIYRLKKKDVFRAYARTFTKTRRTAVPIGARRKPYPAGKPGYIRVDSVHQGDKEKEKGIYHLNLVDEVTQWEVVCCVEVISEQFLLPALEEALGSFPFRLLNLHSDNGSEYINYTVARLLEKLRVTQSKGRSRHCNDNALVEGKNAAVVRKYIGHGHIPKDYASAIAVFYREHFNDFLNFHRCCAFPEEMTLPNGKIKKIYREYRTPCQKLLSLPDAGQYLKEEVTVSSLEKKAGETSHLAAAQAMQQAKHRLFT